VDPWTLEPTVRHDADQGPGIERVVEAQSAQIHGLESRVGQLEKAVESHAVIRSRASWRGGWIHRVDESSVSETPA
jgi:hypothetical protein